ncbi:MAG: hypothetical protein JNL82_17840 [Myxococcales bacterium]|nr:hypothetical protein [Myxococcales bacterium]
MNPTCPRAHTRVQCECTTAAVRGDSTIPQIPVDHWETFNTLRTRAQIENGGLCHPVPPGGPADPC